MHLKALNWIAEKVFRRTLPSINDYEQDLQLWVVNNKRSERLNKLKDGNVFEPLESAE
jgi:predicted DNA-binding protein YlxM (UPF0122 family)